MSGEYGRVVAGVPVFDTRLSMVRWAAAEAAARGATLHLVTAVPAHSDVEQHLPADPASVVRNTARARLTLAAEEAAACRPELRISTELVGGPPAQVLLDAAAAADLLVVGADDQSPFAEAITGSVPGTLLTTSPCPLVVVPQEEPTATADAPVVVATDESGTSQAAVAYTFGAAERSGRPLLVVHCVPEGHHASRPDHARALLGFGALHPGVPVSEETAHGDPRTVLAAYSRRAALLVLGSRGRGRLASTLFGSVSRDLIRRGGCPVVVARSPADSRDLASSH